MTTSTLYYDHYDVTIYADPYPVYRRLREEAPVYYNDKHGYYVLSRFADVERALTDPGTFISGRGAVVELIKSGLPIPPGVIIFEDPPIHTIHRRLLAGVFTPRKVLALEPAIREFTARSLDPFTGSDEFDFIANLGAEMPMRVIGMLLGIPEDDQETIRTHIDDNLRTEAGKPMRNSGAVPSGEVFADYIDWRAEHPSDDLMTDLLRAEFEDETGTRRRLTRGEILTYVTVIAGAGNETTNRLIGWTGKVLGDHPDQRRELVADPGLIPNAIEELLRYEPPAQHIGRYVARDAVVDGQLVPEGSIALLLAGSANRDDRQYPDGDRFDIHREVGATLSFGRGIHFCLGAALARLEGRIALEEILKRFPDWAVDTERATLASTSTVRGWETLPARLG
jgi:cytochrome P450